MDASAAVSRRGSLFRLGSLAPLVVLILYAGEFATIISAGSYPATPQSWFELLHHNRVLGLLFLNAPDIVSMTLVGIMFLAVCVALWPYDASAAAVAGFCSLLGVAAFVSTRAQLVSATLALSERYAAAATETQRAQLLAAGEAVQALGQATPDTVGFLLLAVATLVISRTMVRSSKFSRGTGCVGLAAGVAAILNHARIITTPSFAAALMPVSGLLALAWWLLVSRFLFQLAHGDGP